MVKTENVFTISYDVFMGRGASEILYGSHHRSVASPTMALAIQVEPNLLEIPMFGYFENVEGFSGSNNWVAKTTHLPNQWKTLGPKIYDRPAADLVMAMIWLRSHRHDAEVQKVLQQSEPYELLNQPDNKDTFLKWQVAADKSLLAPVHQVAAIEELTLTSAGSWKKFPGTIEINTTNLHVFLDVQGEAVGALRI